MSTYICLEDVKKMKTGKSLEDGRILVLNPLALQSAVLRGPLRQYSRNIAESTPEKSWAVNTRWAVYKTGGWNYNRVTKCQSVHATGLSTVSDYRKIKSISHPSTFPPDLLHFVLSKSVQSTNLRI